MPEISELLPMVALLLVVGGVAGVIGGLLGVGGGILLVPAYFYTFNHLGYGGDQSMQICVATSLATIVVTSIRSVSSHHKLAAVEWSVLKSWAPFLVVGAIMGVLAAARLPSSALQALFGGVAGIVALWMAFGREDWRLGPEMPGQPARGAMGTGVGFLSAMMGIGGGSFGVPIMTLYGVPIHRAVATAAGFGVLIAVPSVLGFLFVPVVNAPPWTVGAISVPAFLVVIGTTLATTPLGVRLAHAMNPKPLKRAFAVFLALVALNMLRKVAGW